MAFTKIVSPGIDTTGSYTVRDLNAVGVLTASALSGPLTGNATGLTGTPDIAVSNITATGNVSIGGTLTYEDVTNIDSVGVITARSGLQVTSGQVLVAKTTTSITTQGSRVDNGLITVSGNSNSTNLAINGGGNLSLANINSTDNNFSNIGGYNSNGLVVSQIDFINKSHSSRTGDIAFLTHNGSVMSERLRITSAGSIGIGTDNPGTKLDVRGGNWSNGDIVVGQSGNAGRVKFRRGADGSDSAFIGFAAADNNNRLSIGVDSGDGIIAFQTNSAERLRILSNGLIGIGTDNPDNYNPNADDLVIFGTGHQGLTIRSGTSHDGSIMFNDTDNANQRGIIRYLHTDDSMAFHTSGGEALRITSSGFIGAGTASPRRHFHIHETASATVGFQMTNAGTGASNDSQGFQLKVGSDGHAEISQMENSNLRIFTNASERVRISSAGRVAIGNATNNASPTAKFQVKADDGEAADLYVAQFDNLEATAGQSYGVAIRAGSNSTDHGFRVKNRANDTTQFLVRGDGKIGINDTNLVRRLSINNGSADEDIIGMYNDEVGINFGAYGTGHGSYPREATINGTRYDSGSSPYLRIAGQGGIKFCSDLNNERMRINSSGDAIFYGNPSIDATDLYYTNSYSTNGWSTSNWYTVVPHGLTSNSTYLVALVWDWGGSHGSPYYVATQQLYSTVNGTNGSGSENELTPMVSTHTGSTGARIKCRVLAQSGGSPAMQVNMNYTMGSSSYLKVKVWKMTFLNRS